MPDSYLISVGVKADFSELKDQSAAAATGLKEAGDQMAGSLGVAAAGADSAAVAYKALAVSSEAVGAAHSHTVPQVAAASAAIRVFEGALPIRAVERFAVTTLGLGPILQAAFPLIGLIALGEMVSRTAGKIMELRDAANNAAEEIRKSWLEANDEIRRSNDSLELSLDKTIAANDKLLGHRGENALKVAFDESVVSADALGASIDRDLQKFDELIKKKENQVGFWGGILTGKDETKGSENVLTGVEGNIKKVSEEHSDVVGRASESGNKENLDQAQTARLVALQKVYGESETKIKTALGGAQAAQDAYEASGKTFGKDETANINLLSAALTNLSQQQRQIGTEYAEGQAVAARPDKGDNKAESAANKAREARMKADELEYSQLRMTHTLTLTEEAAFWQQRLDTFGANTSEYAAITSKLAEIYTKGAEEAHKSIETFKKEQEKLANEPPPSNEGINKYLREQDEDLSRTGERWKSYNDELAKGLEIQAANTAHLAEAKIAYALATGAISQQSAAHQLAAIHAQEYADKLKILEAELERIKNDGSLSPEQKATQSQGLNNQITQTQGAEAVSAVADQTKQAKAFEIPWKKALDEVGKQFQNVQDQMLKGQISIAQGARRMGSELLLDAVHWGEKEVLQHIGDNARKLASKAATNSAGLAMDAGAAQGDIAITRSAALEAAFIHAKLAAVKAFDWASGWGGPIAGAIAAAGAFTGAMVWAAFEQGGVVGGSIGSAVPIVAHAGERVLSNQQTATFERMVNGGGAGGRGNSAIHSNNTFNGVSDSKTFQKLISKHERTLAVTMKRSMRNGRF